MIQDKIRGSLIGGAIGDALGYPVEFCNYGDILNHYGEQGITRYDLEPYWLDKSEHTGMAVVSDDTQMTMYTACGLLNSQKSGEPLLNSVKDAYLEWLTTQNPDYVFNAEPKCWITCIPEMNVRRAPGNTCLTSLQGIANKRTPINNSKGCGGVMRIAPIPLFAAVNNRMSIIDADRLAGDAAQLTHHHPLGYIPAALMSHIIYRLIQDEKPSRSIFESYIFEGMEQIKELYAVSKTSLRTMERLVDKALTLSIKDQPDYVNIMERLGGGWVAEETLAIAIYCTHCYFDDFEKAIIASVNHGGDSDSTGAVTGNIIGTITGYDAIPQFYKTDLEHHDVILKLSDDLCNIQNNTYIKYKHKSIMANEQLHKDELFINLTIDGTEYEDVEVKVTKPELPIREQIQRIIDVFELPKMDRCGHPIQYLLGQMLEDGEEPAILEFEDEDGREQSLLDCNILSGDCLHLMSVPAYACPVPKDMAKRKDMAIRRRALIAYACPIPQNLENEWAQYDLLNQ